MTYPYPLQTAALPAVPLASPMRLIVAATDFTPAAAAAARRAAALAEAAGARLVLFHAQRSGDAEKARERLRLAAARLRGGAALEVDAHLGYGPAAAAIAAFARAASPDLVVVGNRQPGFLADLLGLGTADRVRRRGASLVLAVARPARLPYGRVVVASDLSQPAADALQTVRRLFPAAETHVLHACPKLYDGTLHFTGVGDLVEAYRRQAIAIGERRLAHFMAKTRAGTGVLAATRLGEAAPAIREYAKEVAADVVIVSPGKSWLARMVGNSVSEQILADPPCDVLLAAWR